ncbi:hypothetical protein JA13_252 [Dickeya phage vB_DsoM_JA13]|uniref:Uncharacterized protein n=1 Tax=Dickeya phage vB_DsoM_JA13 TaxID=2283030 RepID=A0A384ZWR1_9CAUD|nr:hypothetical protein JA13_252 [Dickeya phage vB_DsoM_JA13]
MNSKLALIAAICVEAFTKNETDNIATITVRALLQSANITIQPNKIIFESEDFADDCAVVAELTCAGENIRIESKMYDDSFMDASDFEDARTVVFSEATHSLQFVCSQLASLTLDPEFSIVPLEDTRVCGVKNSYAADNEDVLDEYDDFEERDPVQLKAKRIAFLDKHFGTPEFIRMCEEIDVPAFENKKQAISYFEHTEDDPESTMNIVDTFETYMELDTSSYDWDDRYDLMESIIEKIDKDIKSKNDRKSLLSKIREWIK